MVYVQTRLFVLLIVIISLIQLLDKLMEYSIENLIT